MIDRLEGRNGKKGGEEEKGRQWWRLERRREKGFPGDLGKFAGERSNDRLRKIC